MFGTETINFVQEKYPSVNWLEYVRALTGSHVLISESEKVGIASSEMLKKIDNLLANTNNRFKFQNFQQ